jgi:hypothetical protein
MHLSRYVSYVECISPIVCRMWNPSLPLCVVCGMHRFHYMPCVKYISPFACRIWRNIKKLSNEILRFEEAKYPQLTRD